VSRPHGEPYAGTKPETVDTAKGTHLPDATATPYLIGSILLAFGIQAWWDGRQERELRPSAT
jgi:hypothetical protein